MKLTDNVIHIFTDGACSGNPGPAGAGVALYYNGASKEFNQYLGEGTNNIAELTAIKLGLEAITDCSKPVLIYTDSQYSIGMLEKHWKAKKNVELIRSIKRILLNFNDYKFVKVKGHSGHELNELVDKLAVDAYKDHV